MAKSDEQVMEEFDEAVNMSAGELEEWLGTDESRRFSRDNELSLAFRASLTNTGEATAFRLVVT